MQRMWELTVTSWQLLSTVVNVVHCNNTKLVHSFWCAVTMLCALLCIHNRHFGLQLPFALKKALDLLMVIVIIMVERGFSEFTHDLCQLRAPGDVQSPDNSASLWWGALFRKWSSCGITFFLCGHALGFWSFVTLCSFLVCSTWLYFCSFLVPYFTQQKTRPSGEIQSQSMCMG